MDIIEQATNSYNEDRTATGTVNGKSVRLEKLCLQHNWIKVYVADEKKIETSKHSFERGDKLIERNMNAKEADERFEKLVDKHDLNEKD